MKLHFKQILVTDLPEVLNLFKSAAEKIAKKNIDHWQYWKNPHKEKVQWVKEGIANHEFFFIQNSGKETIGMIRILQEDLLYWGKQNKKALYIHSLVISENYNGKGIGSMVLKMVEEKAKHNNCNFLRLDCDAKNLGLCNYYEKLGFVKVGEKEMPLSVNNLYEKKL